MCVNWNEPSVSRLRLYELPNALEYELVDANGGIQKVRVEPATRSAVATCIKKKKMVDMFWLDPVSSC